MSTATRPASGGNIADPSALTVVALQATSTMSAHRRLRCRTLVLAAACTALGPQFVAAQSEELAEICSGERLPFVAAPFGVFDVNEDERLSEDEASDCPALAAVYSRLDLDADQTLSRAEYRAFADVWRRRKRAFGDDAQ